VFEVEACFHGMILRASALTRFALRRFRLCALCNTQPYFKIPSRNDTAKSNSDIMQQRLTLHGEGVGNCNQAILDHEVTTLEQAQALAADIVKWLVDERIVEDRQCDGCLGKGACYRPGIDFMKACGGAESDAVNGNYAAFSELASNGMRVVAERDFVVNSQGQFGPIPCPRCGTEVPIDDFWNAGSDWCEGKTQSLTCCHCGQASELPLWIHPDAGFVTLAFEFWNWPPLSDDFIEVVRKKLGHRISVIVGKA